MVRFKVRGWRGAVCLLPGMLAAGQAVAAEVASVTLDPITVTATKTARSADRQPFSVGVVGSEELERRQPASLEDVLRGIAGVTVSGGTRRAAQTPNIRGLGGPRVVTLVDGARQDFDAGHKGGIFLEPDILKSVEVLKGAGSALYGSGAIGGVVAFTTKDAADFLRPGETAGARLRVGYSSAFKEPVTSATVYAQPVKELDLLAYGAWRRSGDYRAGDGGAYSTVPYSSEKQPSGLFKATVRPDERHTLSFSAQLLNIDGTAPINTETISTAPSTVADRLVQRRTYTASYAFDDPSLPLIGPRVTVYRNTVGVNERRLSDGRNDVTDVTTTGIDARNTSRFTTGGWLTHAVTVGVERFRDEQQGKRNGTLRTEFPKATADTTGLYLQDELVIADRVTLVPGLRWDSYKREMSGSGADLSKSKLSPRIGAAVEATPWLTLYGSYGQAFRAPSVTELYVSGTHFPGNRFVPNPELRPETARTAEGGMRLAFDDVMVQGDGLRARVGYFDTRADDFISQIVTRTTTSYVNVGKARLHGWEAEVSYDAPAWFASLTGSRIRGDDRDSGQPLDSIPADTLVATTGIKLPDWGVVLGVTGEFASSQDRVPTGGTRTPGYGIADVFASWAPEAEGLDGLRVDVAVKNLFDRYYRNALSAMPRPGRDLRLSVAYTMNF